MDISLFVCCLLSGRGRCDGLRPTECGVSECDGKASIMGRPWPTGGCCTVRGKSKKFPKIEFALLYGVVDHVTGFCKLMSPRKLQFLRNTYKKYGCRFLQIKDLYQTSLSLHMSAVEVHYSKM